MDFANCLVGFCSFQLNEEVGDASERIKEAIFGNNGIIDDYESDDEEDNTESSIDLLFRFLQSMFKKVSKRARKASRSILPDVISPQLVSSYFNIFIVFPNIFSTYFRHVFD